MKKITILHLFLVLSVHLFGQTQKAELLFLDGTTLEGFGMITKNHEIKFRISLEEEPDTWDNLIVKGIIFYGFEYQEEYEFIKINKNLGPKLLRVISKGKVTLYEDRIASWMWSPNNNIGQSDFVYREATILYLKRKEEVIATNFRNFKKTLITYFKDCDVIMDMVASNEYRKYSRNEIVRDYNVFCDD